MRIVLLPDSVSPFARKLRNYKPKPVVVCYQEYCLVFKQGHRETRVDYWCLWSSWISAQTQRKIFSSNNFGSAACPHKIEATNYHWNSVLV